MASLLSLFVYSLVAVLAILPPSSGQLVPDYYDKVCPQALPTIRQIVSNAVQQEPRMGASLLRLHFHDCFVNGCDGSNLLDDMGTFVGEKTAGPNLNSARGFEVIDEIKEAVNLACNGNVVSCADIVAVAARDSVSLLGGPSYEVLLGRKDSRTASFNDANTMIPAPTFDFPSLLSNFESHGLSLKDLVVLSGGHTVGLAHCSFYRARIYNDTDVSTEYAAILKQGCPIFGGDNFMTGLDSSTPTAFDTLYFQGLMQQKGLLHSDQQLLSGGNIESEHLVSFYSNNPETFAADFGASMIKMGNMGNLAEFQGEIRFNCRKIN
ncbi:Peroxidase [Bertholletia excelsa]